MRYRILSLAAALLLAACSDNGLPATQTPVPTGTPETASSPGSSSLGQLAFTRDGNLLAIDLDRGRGRETLLAEAGVAHTPKFSPDGRLVAYAEGSFVGETGAGLFIVPPDGKGHPVPVDRPVAFWEWSPAEPLLAYQLASNNSVWTYDSRSGEKTQVLASHQHRTPFAWSPDGRSLVYGVAEYTAGDAPVFGPAGVEVYDFETRTTRQLVTRNDGSIPHVHSWSPDGSRVAYWLTNISASMNADGATLWWASLKGGATGAIGTTLIYNEAAVWKHTGDSSALAISEGGGREIWDGKDLHLVRPDPPFPSEPLDRSVAAPGFSEVEPSWQPRGTSLAFVRIPEPKDAGASHVDSLQKARIWTVREDGTGETQLTDGAAYSDRLPRFSLDGRQILFLRLRTGEWSEEAVPATMWAMDADGSNLREVADLGRVGWFGYYGRIDPETLFDWYQPDPLQGAARPCAPAVAGAFAEAQAGVPFTVFCPRYLPDVFTLDRFVYGPNAKASESGRTPPPESSSLVVKLVDQSTGAELSFGQGNLGNDLFPQWRQYPPPSPSTVKYGTETADFYPAYEAGDLGMQPAVVLIWDLDSWTHLIMARGIDEEAIWEIAASMTPLGSTPSISLSTSRCSAAQLEVRVRRGSSGLGLGAESLEFNNVSEMPCSLKGPPDVFLLAEPSGRPLSEVVKPCEAPAPPTASICGPEDGVVLDPGERAAVDVLYWSWREDFQCSTPRVRATHLRIDLPGDGGSITAPLDAEGISPCEHELDVGSFRRYP